MMVVWDEEEEEEMGCTMENIQPVLADFTPGFYHSSKTSRCVSVVLGRF